MKTELELLREELADFAKKMQKAGIDIKTIKNRSTRARQSASNNL